MKTKIICVSALVISNLLVQNAFAQEPFANVPNYAMSNKNVFGTSYNYGFSGWSLRAGLRYQQFSNNGTSFAESSDGKIFNISPGYHTGYDLGIGYTIPRLDTEIKLDYRHLHTSDTSTAWADSLTLFPNSLALGPVTWASSNIKFDYDAVDLTASHWINFTPRFRVNYYGGFSYTHLSKDMNTYGTGFGNNIRIEGGTSFRGFGPTFGMDGYCAPFDSYPGFNVYGGVQPTFLYGTMTGYLRTNVNDDRSSDNIPNEKIVVPAVSAKFGIDWAYPIYGALLNVNLGYELNQYWGVTMDGNYTNPVNSSFQGGVFGLKLRF